MALIEWSKALELGIEELDAQHRRLVDLANGLHASIVDGSGQHVVKRCLEELLEYAWLHFGDEERFFQAFNSPNLERHRDGHSEFLRAIEEFGARLDSDGEGLESDVMIFLRSWVARHIGHDDRELVRFAKLVRTTGSDAGA